MIDRALPATSAMQRSGSRLADTSAHTAVPATLAGNAAWLLASNLGYAACQWATIAAFAKLGSATALGHFGLALAITTPVVMVTGVGSRTLQATDAVRRYRFADYLDLRIASNVAAAVIIAAIGMVALDGAALAVLVPLAAAKIAEATSETCYGLAQRHQRMRLVAVSKATRGGLGLLALLAVVALDGTMVAGVWALAATWTLYLLAIDLPAAHALEPALAWPRWGVLRALARESAPLGAVNGVAAVTQSLPRYLLQWSHGAAAVGYFTALAAIAPAVAQLATSVGHAAAPRLGWAAAVDRDHYRTLVARLYGVSTALSVLLVVAAMLGGEPFLRIAFTDEYAHHHTTFVLVVAGAGLWLVNEVAYFALVAARRLGQQLAIQCLSLVCTGVAGVLLIPRFGLEGAAMALVGGGAAKAVLNARIVLRGRAQ